MKATSEISRLAWWKAKTYGLSIKCDQLVQSYNVAYLVDFFHMLLELGKRRPRRKLGHVGPHHSLLCAAEEHQHLVKAEQRCVVLGETRVKVKNDENKEVVG